MKLPMHFYVCEMYVSLLIKYLIINVHLFANKLMAESTHFFLFIAWKCDFTVKWICTWIINCFNSTFVWDQINDKKYLAFLLLITIIKGRSICSTNSVKYQTPPTKQAQRSISSLREKWILKSQT